MKMARLAASLFALAVFALPAAAQQDNSATNPPAATQPSGDVQQALKDFLSDTRPVSQLTLPELRRRLKAGRDLAQNQSLDAASLRQVHKAMKDLRAELQTRQNNSAGDNTVPPPAGQDSQAQAAKKQSGAGTNADAGNQAADNSSATSDQPQTKAAGTQAAPKTQAGATANGQPAAGSMTLDELLADTRPASSLSAVELRQRFGLARSFMTNPNLKPDQKQALQKIARDTRTELGLRAKGLGLGQAAGTGQQQTDNTQGGGASQQQGTNAPAAQSTVDATTILYDNRPLNTLTVEELRNRMVSIHRLFQQGAVMKNEKKQLAAMARAARMELTARGAMPGGGNGKAGGGMNEGDGTQGNGQQGGMGQGAGQGGMGQGGGAKMPGGGMNPPVVSQDAETKAQSFINDARRAEQMPNPDLRMRLQAMRELLQANQLSPATERALRMKLAADRDALRSRLGMGQGMGGQQGGMGGGNGASQQTGAGQAAPGAQVSVTVVLADRRPPNQLQVWELRRRISVLRDALANQQLEAARRAEWQMILERDRQFLHEQLMARRQARMQELNRERQDNQININMGMQFDPGRPPPPPSVFAAEADDQQLADTLSAPPLRAVNRRYTLQEVENSPDLRAALPRVEIDTIHFGFGESFVREEEVGNLDHVAAVLEKILTAHPREVFIIEGHTDAVGSPESNLELSRKRAEAVKQALVDYYVIPQENLQTVGYGERFLKIPTPDPEPENRRVSIVRATPLVGELGQ